MSSTAINAKLIFEKEVFFLKALKNKLDSVESDDPTDVRLAEEASWDYDLIIKYLESRISDFAKQIQ